MHWKLIDYFAFYEIWAKGHERKLINPRTKEVLLTYSVAKPNPRQLKIPFEKGDGNEKPR